MCFAIVEIKYLGNDVEVVKLGDKETLDKKIVELRSKGTVTEYTVFRRERKVTRTTEWREET